MATNSAPADPLSTVQATASPTEALVAPTPPPAAPTVAPAPAEAAAPAPVADPNAATTIPTETETFKEAMGVGVDGEQNIWEARYSMKNFFGRLFILGTLTVALAVLATWVWGYGHDNYAPLPILAGVVILIAWLILGRRIILARFGHYYRLTNRRVFVSTGIFNRRRDQMELLRINDVYTRQSLSGRWLSVGTVVVVSSEPQFPVVYLAGVDDPKYVMDLIWHHARSERDRRTVKVDQV